MAPGVPQRCAEPGRISIGGEAGIAPTDAVPEHGPLPPEASPAVGALHRALAAAELACEPGRDRSCRPFRRG